MCRSVTRNKVRAAVFRFASDRRDHGLVGTASTFRDGLTDESCECNSDSISAHGTVIRT